MSEENVSENKKASEDNKGVNNALAGAAGLIETLKTNPKAMYAAIGAVVVVVLGLAFGGGGEGKKAPIATVGVGQNITLENPNGGSSHLTTIPGMQSASEAEENQEVSVCVVSGGTRATVEEEQMVGQLPYVKLKVLDGDCQGKTGWTSKVNVKAG